MRAPSGAVQKWMSCWGLAVAGGCATATSINRAVPPLAKVIQDSSQTRTTAAAAGAAVPLSGAVRFVDELQRT
jgi:hypothetical protein